MSKTLLELKPGRNMISSREKHWEQMPLPELWSDSSRRSIYTWISIVIFAMSVATGLWSGKKSGLAFNNVRSDGRYYYCYLPSIIIDGDLDFSNQIRKHWDVSFDTRLLNDLTPNGMIRNKYPVGEALTLLPAFLAGHAVALASAGHIAADGYSWPYQVACIAMIAFLMRQTLLMIDSIMTESLNIPALPTVLALLVLVFATPYGYYGWREPFMVHVISLFWCTSIASLACSEKNEPRSFWPKISLSTAMAVVCRPTNAFMIPIIAYGVFHLVKIHGIKKSSAWLPLAAVGILPIGLQLYCWKLLFGSFVSYSYSGETFAWGNPALIPTLLSSRHGLFLWSPVLALSVGTLAANLRHPQIVCWFMGILALWYANSAWHCWWFGDAFGARAFIELGCPFAIGLGMLFDKLSGNHRAICSVVAISILLNFSMMALYISGIVPPSDYWLPW